MTADRFDRASVDHILTTTRSVRRRLDVEQPVDMGVLHEALDIALQAPTGGNSQGWRWLVVTDAEKRRVIADAYARSAIPYLEAGAKDAASDEQQQRVFESASHLVDILADVPVHVIPCIWGRLQGEADNFAASGFYGSAWPAVWSFMLALRARGYGSALTTLHLLYEDEVAAALEIPDGVTQVGLIPVARYRGEGFKPARRRPVEEITYLDTWGRTREAD